MYLFSFNNNLYLKLIHHLEKGLEEVTAFVTKKIELQQYNDLEGIVELYDTIFKNKIIADHVSFDIDRIHKVLYFKEVSIDRINSYYYLKLFISSSELSWLDDCYNGSLSKILKYYKSIFSKIDNIFSNRNKKQEDEYYILLDAAKAQIDKLNNTLKTKDEINSEKKRLKEQYLEKIPFKSLFHITHADNVPGILNYGILSHKKAHEQILCKVDISNPEINSKRSRIETLNQYSIHEYAPLYINPKNPMLSSLCLKKNLREKIVLIRINPNILVNKSVLFTDGNAAEESSNFYNNLDDFNRLDWKCISDEYYFEYKDGKRIKCSEVLVLNQISIPYIDGLITYNEGNFQNIFKLFPNHFGIELSVNRSLFYE